jgi:glycerophosphoryl diester phosphodiesterase
MIEKYKAEAYTMIMAYSFEEAKRCYSLNKNIMMEVFISSPKQVGEFDQTGVPWENIVAFVGHKKPDDPKVFQMIHQKGALCILGTSRNLDREFIEGKVTRIEELGNSYNALYREGADILETDIPVPVSKVVAKRLSSESFKSKFLKD